MKTLVISKSMALNRHVRDSLSQVLPLLVIQRPDAEPYNGTDMDFIIIHVQSMDGKIAHIMDKLYNEGNKCIAIASDHPSVDEFLRISHWPIQAYFHSYMASVHYQQMYRMLKLGLSWFHPETINGLIGLARRYSTHTTCSDLLNQLSNREREIALLVGEGLSNNSIADKCGISESTVKAHLGHIFQKLEISDRLTLALALNRHT